MTRQSLAENRAMTLLAELSGKKTVREIRDHLKANGLISIDVDEQELILTRDLIRRYRRICLKTRDIQSELVNLFEVDEEGVKHQYYKPFRELLIGEAAQLLTKQHGRIEVEQDIFHRYYKPLRKRFGKKLQKLLPFDVSANPIIPLS